MNKEELTHPNELLTKLQTGRDIYSYNIDKESQFEFPRKYLRPLDSSRRLFPYIKDRVLNTRIASHVMHRDTLHWLWLKSDIFGHAREMIIKFQLINLGAILEAVVKHLKPDFAKKDVYFIINKLAEDGFISNPEELKELWKARKSIHLHLTGDVEDIEFSDENYILWHSALGRMIQDLNESLGINFR